MQLAIDTKKNLYPDLVEKGGLVQALQSALLEINSNLVAKESGVEGFPVYARLESEKRFSQIYISSEQRMFIGDFWESGIMLGNVLTDSLANLVEVLQLWLETSISLTELSKNFEFVKPNEKAEYFETGREVECQWKSLQEYIPQSFPELIPFLNEASNNSRLNKLFPFTSMNTFHFSRCTGFPFSRDCPFVMTLEDKKYKVILPNQEFIGEGNAKEAVELIIKNLPPNTNFAIRGTKDDL